MYTEIKSNEYRGAAMHTRRCAVPGIRFLFSAMGFLGFCTLYALRVNINVAIVAMVNTTAAKESSSDCFAPTTEEPPRMGNAEFDWSSQLQAIVLGSFYYGYCASQIPGGRMAEIFSAKWVFGGGTLITAVLALFTPFAARYHVGLLVAVRAAQGLAQGVTMPAMHSMLGRWLPECERGLLSTIVYCGINIGTVVAMPLSGILCQAAGWPAAFYVFGISGCIWFLLWCILISDTPLQHPCISKKELDYIISNQKIEHEIKLPPIPWLKVATCVPFLALIVTQIGQDWCFYTFVNEMPTFMATILHTNIEKNGFLSSFPYLLQTVVGCLVGFLCDMAIYKQKTTTNFVRKFCNTVACIGTATGLLGVTFAGCDVTLTIVFYTFSMAIGGFCYSGYMLSHIDLSPEYAGTLMGIANTISNLTGFLAPLVVGSLTENEQTLAQWRIILYIVIALLLVTSVIFLMFSSAKKQNWAVEPLLDSKNLVAPNYGSTNAVS